MQLHQSNRFSITVLVTSLCLLVLSHPAWAQSIPLVNASFEDPAVPDGNFYNSVGPVYGGTPGWNFTGYTNGNGSINAIINPGGPDTFEPWSSTTPPGMDGTNFCQLFVYIDNGTGVLWQDTQTPYQAGKTYVLTADFGLQDHQTLASGGQMFLADSDLNEIAGTTISASNLVSEAFTPQSVTYTATGKETGGGTHAAPGNIIIGFYLPVAPAQTYLDFDNVQLTVVPQSPSIVAQPQSQVVQTTGNVTLSVTASGSAPLSYQWNQNGSPLNGASASSLTINNLQIANAGSYTVRVSNAFGQTLSQQAKLTVLSNLDGTVTKPAYPDTPTIPPGKDSLVFITHGRTNTNPPDIAWISTMRDSIDALPLPANWYAVDYPWTEYSQTDIVRVTGNAQYVGRKAGKDIVDWAQLTPNHRWEHIHFIAHSAGAALVEEAAKIVRTAFPQVDIHTTLLDPYTGFSDEERGSYGAASTWTDDYFDIDSDTHDNAVSGTVGLGPYGRTSGPLTHAFSVDVTALDTAAVWVPEWRAQSGLTGEFLQPISTHSWPISFYQNTIPPNQQAGSAGFGFTLSAEAGGSTTYSPNSSPLILGSSHSAVQGPINQSLGSPLNLGSLPSAISQTGTLQTNGLSFSAVTGIPAASNVNRLVRSNKASKAASASSDATAPPAWISIPVDTSTNVNFVSFSLSFTAPTDASGLVTVYWNGVALGILDEDYVLSGSQTYLFEIPNAFLDRSNCLGFRVDSFSSTAASINVSNVSVGSGTASGGPTLIAGSDPTNEALLTLFGTQGYTYQIEASTDLTNWSVVAHVNLNDGSVAEFIDNDAASFTKRFYRAVYP
jgi:hypothetical protein